MKLDTLDFIKLLPDFMRDDGCVKALSESINTIFRPTAQDLKKLSDWDRIDSMTEAELDELAWECDISWYDKTASLEAKRSICKNSDRIFMTRATTAAVEEVLATYFSNAKLREHFMYDNIEPHYFKIETTDVNSYTDKLLVFLSALEKTKRKSQWLDAIVLLLQGAGEFTVGIGVSIRSKTTFDCRENL
ncbi:MAG: phage tail protein I [Cyanobacteria bacterium SIG32]|nr:phage tail protein I [Cyanobacteria bacterium SIG32]